jgi:hypothetical protein
MPACAGIRPVARMSEAICGTAADPHVAEPVIGRASARAVGSCGLRPPNTTPHSRDTMRPSFGNSFAPRKKEGALDPQERARGRPGARCTRGLVCKGRVENAHEHTGSAETLRPSPRDGFTAYSVLSPARPELACHRRPRDTKYHRELDTSHRGVRTTRLCRTHQPRSSVAAFASTAPRPNVSDDGQRPLYFRTGWRE